MADIATVLPTPKNSPAEMEVVEVRVAGLEVVITAPSFIEFVKQVDTLVDGQTGDWAQKAAEAIRGLTTSPDIQRELARHALELEEHLGTLRKSVLALSQDDPSAAIPLMEGKSLQDLSPLERQKLGEKFADVIKNANPVTLDLLKEQVANSANLDPATKAELLEKLGKNPPEITARDVTERLLPALMNSVDGTRALGYIMLGSNSAHLKPDFLTKVDAAVGGVEEALAGLRRGVSAAITLAAAEALARAGKDLSATNDRRPSPLEIERARLSEELGNAVGRKLSEKFSWEVAHDLFKELKEALEILAAARVEEKKRELAAEERDAQAKREHLQVVLKQIVEDVLFESGRNANGVERGLANSAAMMSASQVYYVDSGFPRMRNLREMLRHVAADLNQQAQSKGDDDAFSFGAEVAKNDEGKNGQHARSGRRMAA